MKTSTEHPVSSQHYFVPEPSLYQIGRAHV